MGSPATSSVKRIVMTVSFALALGAVGLRIATDLLEPVTDQDMTIATTPVAPARPLASGQPAGPAVQGPVVEVAPPAEEAPPVAEQPASYGRRAGLHKARDELHLSASAALVLHHASGEILFRKNEQAVLPIASLTKLMTALVFTEAMLPMEREITIAQEDVDGERHSRSRLRVGSSLSRGEALQLALMSSENRAAHALGRTYPAGLPAFVQAMNRKARALGMKNTTFVDPTGLSTGNQSNALDLARLVAAASKHPVLAGYSTAPEHLLALAPGRTLRYRNSNRLVKNPKWDIALQKTGYIVEAGWCMVLDTRIGGQDVVVVLLDAAGKGNRLSDAERIRRFVASQPGLASTETGAERRPARS